MSTQITVNQYWKRIVSVLEVIPYGNKLVNELKHKTIRQNEQTSV